MRIFKISFLILALALVVLYSYANAGTCWNGGHSGTAPWTVLDGEGGSPSCAYVDVNYCVNTVTSAGDAVYVGAGSATWSTQLAITGSVTLVGAGIDVTTITNGIANDFPILIQPAIPADDPLVRVTGFTIDGDEVGGCIYIVSTDNTYAYHNFRIDHNKLKNTPAAAVANWAYMAIKTYGNTFGLIDNNQFVDNNYDFKPLGNNVNSWTNYPAEANLGTRNYLYIEDNTSTGIKTVLMSSGEGARWVYRYNTINNSNFSWGNTIWDAHGDTNNRGVVAHELYENIVTADAESTALVNGYETQQYRGGTGIIYNNTVQTRAGGGWGQITVREEYHNEPPGYTTPGCGDKVTGGYIWNNKNVTEDAILKINEDDEHDCIAEDTDWWDDGDSDGGLEASCNFSYDVAANRSGTCSDDDCYWETDNKKLYRCDGVNNWTEIYTPYTYPHPLRGESSFCGDGNCDNGECISGCTDDCSIETCCGIEGCNVAIGETAVNCAGDCSDDEPPAESGTPNLSSVTCSGVTIH